MEHSFLEFILVTVLFLGLLALAIYITEWDVKSYKKCTCGQFDKCKEYTETTAHGRITKHGMFLCPKRQQEFKELLEHPFIKQVKTDIKEKGHSGPY